MSSVVIMADVSSKHGSAITKMIVGMVAMRKAAFIHLAHQENSLVPITAASHNLKYATALMTAKTMLLPTRHMNDVLAILHAR